MSIFVHIVKYPDPYLLWSFYFHCSIISEASMEVDVSKGRRDWAFSERDKVGKFCFQSESV